jgi:hypothetical protein
MEVIELLAKATTVIGVPLLRALIGWLNTAFEDGKIEVLEVRKLLETIVRVGIPAIAAYFGIGLLGLNVDIIAPVIGASLIDWYLTTFKKANAKAVGEELKVAMVGYMRVIDNKETTKL